jgi:hypothetical protein
VTESISEFRFSVTKVAILALFSLLLAGGFVAAVIGSPMNPVLATILILGAIFFTFWSFSIGSQLLNRRVILAFDSKGVLDQRIGPNVIPWSEIDEIYLFRARSQRFLAVVVDDPDKFAAPTHWADKLSLWMNRMIGLPRFSLALMGLDGSTAHILEAMTAHLPDQFDQDSIIR